MDADVSRVIKELTSRFKQAVDTGDDACIPPDLVSIVYWAVRSA